MAFSSVLFLFVFLPVVIFLYFLLPLKLKNYIFLLASLLFYIFGEKWFIFLLCAVITINYISVKAIERIKTQYIKKVMLVCTIILNVLILVIYKYTNFLIDNINILLSNFKIIIEKPQIHFPLGISFITFQCISFVVDFYRGEIKAKPNLVSTSVYILMFPKLIAGPIVRYKDIAHQLLVRDVDIFKIEQGIVRFIIGLGKKVIIADTMGLTADAIFGCNIDSLSTFYAWIGIVAYTLQIYYDFSGYSDMAIGLCKIFGFDIPENFNYPYSSKSITEFWRRWHISLSTWFKDYLYIPLGGNRKGKIRTYINLMIVFFTTGLWHGASWTFVFWGLYHGMFLIIERLGLKKILEKHKIAATIYTILIIMIGWVFFRSENILFALQYLKKLFIWNNAIVSFDTMRYVTKEFFIYTVVGIVFSFPITPYIKNKILSWHREQIYTFLLYGYTIITYIISFIYIAKGTYHPFIYFGF